MTRAQIVACVAILAALVAVAAWQRRPVPADDGARAVIVEPGTLGRERVARISIEREDRPGQAGVMVLDEGGWLLSSRDDAPVSDDRVDRLLEAVDGLVGEVRADDPSLLPEFMLAGDGAIHLRFDDAEGDELVRLVVGKRGPRSNRSFVRPEGDDRAWLGHAGLHGALGIHGHGDRPLDVDFFLDLHLFGVEAEAVRCVRAEGAEVWGVERDGPEASWRWTGRDDGTAPDERAAVGRAYSVARARATALVGRGGDSRHGLEMPHGRLEVCAPEGTRTLRIGATAPPEDGETHARDERFVAMEGSELVWRMSQGVIDALLRPVEVADGT